MISTRIDLHCNHQKNAKGTFVNSFLAAVFELRHVEGEILQLRHSQMSVQMTEI